MKKHVVRALETLAFMNLVLAFSTAFASSIVFIILGISLRYEPLLIILLVTFAGYTINRFTDKEDWISHPKRSLYIKEYGGVLFFVAVLTYVLAIFIAGMRNVQTLFMTLLAGVAIMLYSFEWIPKGRSSLAKVKSISRLVMFRRIKELHFVKNIFVAVIWSLGVVFLPISYVRDNLPLSAHAVLFLWMFFFGRFLINTIVFDLKDIEGDRRHNVRSLPVTLGYDTTRKLMAIVNIILFLIITAVILAGYLPGIMHIPNIFSMLYTFFYLYQARHKSSIHFTCDVFVDAEYIIMTVPLYIYTYLFG